jgi:hypothetical protein
MTPTRALVLACLLAACAHAAPSAPPPHVGVSAPESPPVSVEDDALSHRLEAYGLVLASRGFKPTGFSVRGFLPPSERSTHAVRVAPERCLLFVAIASASVGDLDAALYGAGGRVIAEDEGGDARPVLSVCSGREPLDLYYSVRAYQGAGAFVTGAFERAALPGDALAVLGSAGPSPLFEQTRLLRKRGFEPDQEPVDLALVDGAPVRMALRVNAGECYTLVAEGRDGLEALSMRLLDPRERELAFGVGDTGLAALQYCAGEGVDLGLELSAGRGQGTARVARFRGPQSVVGGARALWLGEPSPSQRAFGKAKTREGFRALLSREKATLLSFEQRTLAQGQVLELSVPAAAARCERFYLALSGGLSRASLRVESNAGELLGEAESGPEGTSVSLCDRRTPARVVVQGRAGFGAVELVRASVKQ